jgi:NADP-dependent 3-hydroxy acid dehydrogenase YdfG
MNETAALAGQVALVTGASSGLGRATAFALARAGAGVGLLARSQSDLAAVARDLSSNGTVALALARDLADADGLADAVRSVKEELGPLRVLVNAAGTDAPGPVSQLSVKAWDRVLAVNLRAVFILSRLGVPDMIEAGQGTIINISSVAGKRGWADASAYDSGPAIWNRVLRSLAASEELDIAESARMFAMTNLAAADGSIGCWNDKYYWNFWRPITAIRDAAADGNPATMADPAWLPLFSPTVPVSGALLVTPGFPDHPSGHTCISGATLHALKDFFATDKIAFTALSNKCSPAPCPARSFDRFSQALKEIIDARVWSGIHFRTADVQGAVLGKKVAHHLRKHYFQPLD